MLTPPASPSIIRPRFGQFRPPGMPEIDYQHPLAQGIEFYAIDTGSAALPELVKNRKASLVAGGNPVSATPTAYGTVLFHQTADTFTFGIDARLRAFTASGNWTAACAYVTHSPAQGCPFGRTATDNSTNPFANWRFDTNADTSTGAVWNTGGVAGSFTFIGQNTNTFSSAAMVASGGTQVKAYFQGQLQNVATGQTIQSSDTGDSVLFAGQSSSGIIGSFNGFIYYGAFWSRALSDAEILKLHTDPYCFLIFPQDMIFAAAQALMAHPVPDDGRQPRPQPIPY